MTTDPLPLSVDRPLEFTLGQPWNGTLEDGFRPTTVVATFVTGLLMVRADLVDDEVFNDATHHNQRTWESGDVFEIFVRREDEQRYREVHVTPDNFRLHLVFDDFEQHRDGDPLSHAADPDVIRSSALRTTDGWQVTAAIPVDARPGDLLRVSFCRYDAARDRDPILSTSSPHREVAFHRPLEWTLCRIES